MKTKITIALFTLLLISLISCSQNKLVNRWTAAGHYSNGKVEAEDNEGREYEFLKNGTLNIYSNGSIQSTASYTLAADSKSIAVKEGRSTGTIKVMKLTTSELIMIFSPGKDTIVFYPSGSSASKQSQAKAVSFYELQKRWNNLLTEYQNRSDIVGNIINMTKASGSANSDALIKLAATRKETQEFDLKLEKLSKEKFQQYEILQERYSKEISEFLSSAKNYRNIGETLNSYAAMFPKMDVNIKKARAEFVPAFNAYKANKS